MINRRISGISGDGIGILPFIFGLAIGVFLGPTIITTTKGGRVWIEKQAREAEARMKEK